MPNPAPPPAGPLKVHYSTSGTVSSPLDLDSVKGEHQSVSVNGRKVYKPRPKVTLTSLTPNNVGTLKKINSVVIPIVYSDKFYKDVLSPELEDVNKLIYYGDIPVGAVCCRFDNLSSTDSSKPPTLVILTLAILAPYRSQGLGYAILHSSLHSSLHPTPPPPPLPSTEKPHKTPQVTVAVRKSVKRAMAHVQVGNEDAKRFYERLGFKEGGRVEGYYSKVEPKDAILMVCEDISVAIGEEGKTNGSS